MRFSIKITDNFILEPIMHTFGCRPETSYIELNNDTLDIRMGSWFHEIVPLSQIAQLATSEWPWWGGLGVKIVHHGVGVVASLDGIVNLKLKSPQKMRVVFEVQSEQLFLSLEDRDGFLRALSEATDLPISAHVPF